MNLTTIKQQFFVASEVIERHGGDEDDLTKMFGKVRGKQLYNLVQMDRYFPYLGTRFASLATYKKLDYTKLEEMIKRADIDQLGDDEVMKFFDIKERPQRCKIMKRKDIESLAMSCPVPVIADTARAIAENNMDHLNKYLHNV